MRKWLAIAVLMLCNSSAWGLLAVRGWCEVGATKVYTSGLPSYTTVQVSYPQCTVTVYIHGTTNPATIYADAFGTPLAYQFTANVNGSWIWYGADGHYDVVMSHGDNGGFPTPVTYADIYLSTGGGGGGGNPCGILYDVQINDPLGVFGCDSGFFYETPSNHTLYDSIFSATQQVVVTDPTNSGQVQLGHSNGTAIDSIFTQSVASTFSTVGGGWGVDWPNDAPTSANQALTVSAGSVGADGRWLTKWANPIGLINAEWLPQLFDTNCSIAQGTCSDIVFSKEAVVANVGYDGPTNPTLGLPFPQNISSQCQDYTGLLTTYTCPFPAGVQHGNHLLACFAVDSLSGKDISGVPTDTLGNTFTRVRALSPCYIALNAKDGTDSVTFNFTGAVSATFKIWEEVGASHITPIDAFGSAGGLTPTQTLTFTTGQPDGYTAVIIESGPGGLGYQQMSSTATYNQEAQSTHYGGAGTGPSFISSLGWGQLSSTGVQAVTMTCLPQTVDGTGTCSNVGEFMAFKASGPNILAYPSFRLRRYLDLVAGGDFPAIAAGNAGQALVGDPTGTRLVWGSGAAGTVTNVMGTANQINVATGTTTPVISLSSTIAFPGSITMGANAADFSSATSFNVPVGAGATSAANGAVAYDTTGKNTHFRANNADAIAGAFPSAPTTGHCVDTVVSGGNVLLHDTGAACGSGSGTITAVTGTPPIASSGGTTPAISLQNSASANVTAALGTDTKYFTASGSAAVTGHGIIGDAQGGIADSGAAAGTVTTVTGTTNQINVAAGTTTPVVSLDPQYTVNSYGTCTNTADALTLTPADAPTALANGLTVTCKSSAANTTATPTLNVNSLGAKTIVKAGASGQAALVANDILTNMVATFKYNAATTTWELQNPQQPVAGGLTSLNSDTTAAQVVTVTSPITITNSGATHTIGCATCATGPSSNTVGGIMGGIYSVVATGINNTDWLYPWSDSVNSDSSGIRSVMPFSAFVHDLSVNIVATSITPTQSPVWWWFVRTPSWGGLITSNAIDYISDFNRLIVPPGATGVSSENSAISPLYIGAGTTVLATQQPASSSITGVISPSLYSWDIKGSTSQPVGATINQKTIAGSTTVYSSPGHATTATLNDTTESNTTVISPCSGTIKNLWLPTNSGQPAGGALSATVRLWNAGTYSSSSVVATIPASASLAQIAYDGSHTLSVTAGQGFDVQLANASGSTSASISGWDFEFASTDTCTGMIFFPREGAGAYATGGDYLPAFAAGSHATTEVNIRAPMPRAATARNLYCTYAAPPITNDLVLTLVKNGVDSALTTTIHTTDACGSPPCVANDTTHTVSFNQYDTFELHANQAGGSVATLKSCSMGIY